MAATKRSSVQDQIAEVTECSICTEIITEPKILPCVHTFCLHCLEKYGKDKKPGDQMVCPLCRKEFFIPDGGFSHLPSNFFIGKLVEIGKLTSTPASKSLCAICPEEEEVLAQLFCLDCEQNLCTRCGNGHKKLRFNQHHQVVELGSQQKSLELNLRNSYCDHHPGEMIKMFCYEDNVSICLVCCVESHQSHRCVNVNKVAGEFTEQLKGRTQKVANRLSECVEFGETLDKFKKKFQESVAVTEESIGNAVNKLKKLLDQHANQLVHGLKLVRDRNLKAFEITKQDIDRFRVMIDSFSRYSEELLTRGSPVDICRTANQMLTRAQELETLPANCSGDSFFCNSVNFHPVHIENLMRSNGWNNAVGELTVTTSSDWSLNFGRMTSADHNTLISDGAIIDVSNIPEDMSERALQMLIENRQFREIVEVTNIAYGKGRRSAVITLSDPEDAEILLSEKTVAYKGHELSFARHVDKANEREQFQRENKEAQPASFNRSIFVSQIPPKLNKSYLGMYFESICVGGGEIEDVDYDREKGTAVITFKDPSVAASFLKKGVENLKGQRVLVTRHEDQIADAGRGKDSDDDDVNVRGLLSPKYVVSGSFNTVKISGIPKDVSKEIISTYFENKKLSGGGIHRVIEHQLEKGKVVLQFDDPGDAIEVSTRRHILHGVNMKTVVLMDCNYLGISK